MKSLFRWMTCCVLLFGQAAWAGPLRVLCTTFPIYQIARNVMQGRDGVEVELLLPASLGCPHHYALTPADMRKLSRAEVLVVNGLGMEEFLGAPLQKANPELRVIDSSEGVGDLLPQGRELASHGHVGGACSHAAHANPHLFASPRMSARLALNLAAALSEIDPEGAGEYYRHASAYAMRMHALSDEMQDLGRRLHNPRVVQSHSSLDYLARDLGLDIVGELQAHGQEPSAAAMMEILRTVREQSVGAILMEASQTARTGEIIAREAGLPLLEIESGASGPEAAPLDYFETTMHRNMQIIREALVKP